ncbi:MAG: hypothetical protein H7331_08120 [Bacteroidia bacterium]|nr:hypothetical protein [Bacteroidia bacterium]
MKTQLNYKLKLYHVFCKTILKGLYNSSSFTLFPVQKKMHSAVAVIIVLLTLKATSQAQNIGINNLTPDASAIMDISHSSRGLLIPRLPLTSTTDVITIVSPALSLLVFNTATAGVSPNDVTPGYYYWNGIKWVGISGDSWRLTGNAGTTAGTNFVGTIDNKDLVFKTNSIENMRILNTNGNVGIGTTTPALKLHLHDGAQNFHAIRLTSGISQANYWDIVKRGDTYGVGQNHNFAFAYNLIELVTISPTGNVGIAVNTPTQKLDIAGSIKITDGTEGISKVLTSDATGKGTWKSLPTSTSVAGTFSVALNINIPATAWWELGTVAIPSAGIWNVTYNCRILHPTYVNGQNAWHIAIVNTNSVPNSANLLSLESVMGVTSSAADYGDATRNITVSVTSPVTLYIKVNTQDVSQLRDLGVDYSYGVFANYINARKIAN